MLIAECLIGAEMAKKKNTRNEDSKSAPAAEVGQAYEGKTKSKTREYVESLIIAAIIAFFVRSFFIQAFKIPSSSMEPTLLIGDHLLVNRLSYSMKVPFTDIVILNLGKPNRGDVVVFRYPVDPTKDFIKRVIATEGDVIDIKDKAVYVNGKKTEETHAFFADSSVMPHYMSPKDNLGPITVPKGSIFVMGDNRDRSLDSRFWGFVKQDLLVGRALILYFSWDANAEDLPHYVRWLRIGRLIR
jgi:signal peptidase I